MKRSVYVFPCTLLLIVGLISEARAEIKQSGFLYTGGTFTTIVFPGATSTQANDINDRGQIVGTYGDARGVGHGFLYTGGAFTTLPDIPGSISTQPEGINAAGQIVGNFFDASGTLNGYLYTGGAFTTIHVPGSTVTEALKINDTGQIVGSFNQPGEGHGFLYTGGIFTTLGDRPGSVLTPDATGINDRGQIVGDFEDAMGNFQGYLNTGGTFTTIHIPGSIQTFVTDINDTGQVVGTFNPDCSPVPTCELGVAHGFFLAGAGGPSTFIIPLDPPGSTFTSAHGINDTGQVVGIFLHSTTVPEPATWLLLASGLVGLAFARRKLVA